MPDIETALAWRGRTVRDRDGEKVGTFGAIYLEGEETRAPRARPFRGGGRLPRDAGQAHGAGRENCAGPPRGDPPRARAAAERADRRRRRRGRRLTRG